jgi:hypothetical protein
MQERAAELVATRPVCPTDGSLATKEAPETQKIKLQDGSIFNISIYSRGSTEEYLAHLVAVLCIINQKGLDVQCRMLAKAVAKLTGTFKDPLEGCWVQGHCLVGQ